MATFHLTSLTHCKQLAAALWSCCEGHSWQVGANIASTAVSSRMTNPPCHRTANIPFINGCTAAQSRQPPLNVCTARVYCPCVLPVCTARVYCPCVLPVCTARVYCPCVLPLCTAPAYCPCVLPLPAQAVTKVDALRQLGPNHTQHQGTTAAAFALAACAGTGLTSDRRCCT
jgi:hypothetical protein